MREYTYFETSQPNIALYYNTPRTMSSRCVSYEQELPLTPLYYLLIKIYKLNLSLASTSLFALTIA